MKYKILYLPLIALIICIFFVDARAQGDNFRVGETVETSDGRVCKILTITGRSAKVACGANRSDLRVYSFDSMTSERAAQAKREELERQKQNAANQPLPTKVVFKQGDAVIAPDGRDGVIDSIKDGEMAKVRFGASETKYFLLTDLKMPMDSSQPTFRVGDRVFTGGKSGVIEAVEGNGFKVRFGSGKYDYALVLAKDLMTPQQAAVEQENARQEQAQKPLRARSLRTKQSRFSIRVTNSRPFSTRSISGAELLIRKINSTKRCEKIWKDSTRFVKNTRL